MKAKEKAKELVERFLALKKINPNAITRPYNYQEAKQGALICVNEILKIDPQTVVYVADKTNPFFYNKECKGNTVYWSKVKQQIEKL